VSDTQTDKYDEFARGMAESDFDINDPNQAVTLAAYVVGPNIKRIASFLERPRSWVAEPARNLRENGVWRSGMIAVEGEDGPDGVELAIQCAVAAGHLEVGT
jgi:hypothetical protein